MMVWVERETRNELRPLHIAAIYDARECMEYLLEQVYLDIIEFNVNEI